MYTGLCGCSMEQPYRDNALIVKRIGLLHGASAVYHTVFFRQKTVESKK